MSEQFSKKDDSITFTNTKNTEEEEEEGLIMIDNNQKPSNVLKKHSGPDFDWSPTEIEIFIKLWQQEEILYNTKLKNFHTPDDRNKALVELQKGLVNTGIDITIEMISNKIKSLRTYYLKERARVLSSRAHGDETYVPKWRFFDDLSFLDAYITPRKDSSEYSNKDTRRQEMKELYTGLLPKRPKVEFDSMRSDSDMSEFREITDNNVVHVSSPLYAPPPPPSIQYTEVDVNDSNFLFGKVVEGLIRKVPEGSSKELLKLDIQKMIVEKAMLTNNGSF